MELTSTHKNRIPLYAAIAIAIIAVIYYIFSGQGSLDLGTRQLNNTKQIEKIDAGNPQDIKVKCKNGESYQILFKPGQSNYSDLIFNACGSEGTQE